MGFDGNPFADRLATLVGILKKRRLAAAFVCGEANIRSLTGVVCDNAVLAVSQKDVTFFTDFRYIPMVKRVAPGLKLRKLTGFDEAEFLRRAAEDVRPYQPSNAGRGRRSLKGLRFGYEGSLPASDYLDFAEACKGAKGVDIERNLLMLRAVKTPAEIVAITEAEALNDEIWARAQKEFRFGMTEKDMQRIIRAWMNALGDGEAFETIVCVGANAAECHHVPDATVWHKGEALLVDMGVRLNGVASDMTRCLKPDAKAADAKFVRRYGKIYKLVLQANTAAIAALKPGMTGKQLDAVARKIIKKAGYGKDFGHALGHGVGYEIHERPVASTRSKDDVLKPGMFVTIEPGVYLEGELGIRIEDLVLVTKDGARVLTRSAK